MHDHHTSNEIAVLIAHSTFERIVPGSIVTTTLTGVLVGPLVVLGVTARVLGSYAWLQAATTRGAIVVVHLHRAKTDPVSDADGFVMHLVLG